MCGIIGYQGKQEATNVLIKGLRSLAYRGYDSAGITLLTNDELFRVRAKGKLDNLIQKLNLNKTTNSKIGIGHTRWATHGIPSEQNAHPHHAGDIAIVHNLSLIHI